MPPASMAAKRIAREMKELQRADLPAGCRCAPVNAEVSLFEWEASIGEWAARDA